MIPSADSIFPSIARALDVCALRQAVHSANVANAGVEGYQRLEVSFEAELSQALGEPQVVRTHDAVKLDQEMASMAQNALRYQMLANAFDKSAGLLRLAIREGRE